MKDQLKQYPLKAPESLFIEIEVSAVKNERSVNKEIIHALKCYLSAKEDNKKT